MPRKASVIAEYTVLLMFLGRSSVCRSETTRCRAQHTAEAGGKGRAKSSS